MFRRIFERYEEALAGAGEIDFHDMINRATDLVEEGRYRSPFGYILVDEFQDISPSRARLLMALLDSSPGAQAVRGRRRLAGDLPVRRLGHRGHAGVRRSFRVLSSASISQPRSAAPTALPAVATDFVLRNPAQIRKTVRATRKADRPAVYVGLPGEEELSLLKEALDRIEKDVRRHDGIVRGADSGPLPASAATQSARAAEAVSRSSLHMDDRAPLEGSRGADYAVVLGLCSGKHGFPAEIADDPLLDLVLAVPRIPSERRGAAPALCCHHAGETAGLPACRRWPTVGIRDGVE